jgi:tetratricopeptide (TPR) repeat protein
VVRASLTLLSPRDALGRGASLGQLGKVALARFNEATKRQRAEGERLRFLNDAARYYEEALELFPPSAIIELGSTQNMLGYIFGEAGDLNRALQHYQQSIRYREQAGDVFGSGLTRYNVAIVLLSAGRFEDARAYAKASLANYRTFGDRAAEKIQKAEQLLALIDQAEANEQGTS